MRQVTLVNSTPQPVTRYRTPVLANYLLSEEPQPCLTTETHPRLYRAMAVCPWHAWRYKRIQSGTYTPTVAKNGLVKTPCMTQLRFLWRSWPPPTIYQLSYASTNYRLTLEPKAYTGGTSSRILQDKYNLIQALVHNPAPNCHIRLQRRYTSTWAGTSGISPYCMYNRLRNYILCAPGAQVHMVSVFVP